MRLQRMISNGTILCLILLFLMDGERLDALAPGSSLGTEDGEKTPFYESLSKDQKGVTFHILVNSSGEIRLILGEFNQERYTKPGEILRHVFQADFGVYLDERLKIIPHGRLKIIPLTDATQIPEGQLTDVKSQLKPNLRSSLGNDLIRLAYYLIDQEGFPSDMVVHLANEKVKPFTAVDALFTQLHAEIVQSRLGELAELPLVAFKEIPDRPSKTIDRPPFGHVSPVQPAHTEPVKPSGDEIASKIAEPTQSELADTIGAIRRLLELDREDQLTPALFDSVLSEHRITGESERTEILGYILFIEYLKQLEGMEERESLKDLLFKPQQKKGWFNRLRRGKTERAVDSYVGQFKLNESVLGQTLERLEQGQIPEVLQEFIPAAAFQPSLRSHSLEESL